MATDFSAITATMITAGQSIGVQWTVKNRSASGGTAHAPWSIPAPIQITVH